MKASNPALIPRNHRVEEALAAAVDCQDYKPMEKFLAALGGTHMPILQNKRRILNLLRLHLSHTAPSAAPDPCFSEKYLLG